MSRDVGSEAIATAIAAGESLALEFPWGRVFCARPFPYLLVHRRREHMPTETAAIVRLLESYVTADAAYPHEEVAATIREIVGALADAFGSVLLLEVWAAPSVDAVRPHFCISVADQERSATVDALVHALTTSGITTVPAEADVATTAAVTVPGLPPLLSPAEARELGCLHLGLSIPDDFVDRATGAVYPLRLRALQAHLASSIQRAAVEFAQQQTTFPPDGYRAFGGRALGEAAGSVDGRLAAIEGDLDFLLAVTPVNLDQAWQEFQESGYRTEPAFHYRPLAVDPDLVRRELYDLPVEDVEDPTVGALFRAKREELDLRVRMLADRGTERFLLTSIAEFGRIGDDLVSQARDVLDRLDPAARHREEGPVLSAARFADRARAEVARYRVAYPELHIGVHLRDDISGAMVVAGDLLIGSHSEIAAVRATALVHHEVGTHSVTHVNGSAQPLQLLAVGLPGYEETQEGLAVFAEYLVGGLTRARLAVLAARVLAASAVESGASFLDTFRLVHNDLGLAPSRAFNVTMRVHRGGGLTKDAMYLRGLDAVLTYVAADGRLEPLLVGKLALEDVPVIEDLLWRGVLWSGPLRPHWLDDPETQERLANARGGLTLVDLTQGDPA